MAAKVTIQQVDDAGFRAAQFGTPADWATAENGYVARVIAEAEGWTRGRVGDDAYDTATGFVQDRLTAAEFAKVACLLWRRRAAFIDSNAASSLDRLAHSDRRQYNEMADAACDRADAYITEALAGEPDNWGGAAVLAGAESGPFAATTSTYAYGERLP